MQRFLLTLGLVVAAPFAFAGETPTAKALDLGKRLAGVGKLTDASLKPFVDADEIVRKELFASLKQTKVSDDNRLALCQFALKRDPSEAVRSAAAVALVGLGNPAAVKTLVDLLGDKSPALRKAACDGLYGYRGDKTLGPKFAKLLTDDSLPVRQSAVRTLGKLGDRLQVPTILTAYKKIKTGTDADAPFGEALALMGETDVSLEIARVSIKSRNYAARLAAVTAIECNPSVEKTVPIIMENLIMELSRTTKLDSSKKDWDAVYVTMCSELGRRTGNNYGHDAIRWYQWWDGVRAKYKAPAPAFEEGLVSGWMETYRQMGPSKIRH